MALLSITPAVAEDCSPQAESRATVVQRGSRGPLEIAPGRVCADLGGPRRDDVQISIGIGDYGNGYGSQSLDGQSGQGAASAQGATSTQGAPAGGFGRGGAGPLYGGGDPRRLPPGPLPRR